MGDNKDDQGPGTPDEDATELNPDESLPGEKSAAPAPPGEYTEYKPSTLTSAGFDHARQLAQKARTETGRLLKKRFVLEDVLGEGGMGLVYKARDLRKVEAEDRNPYIAVKVLGQNFKDHPQAFVSLQQEAVKSQKLAHPNIVTVHDFDRDGNTIFMTMELLKGDPLDSLLKLEAPFGKEVALRYFKDLCAGLDYAHKRDLIHSDFKPGNIFVTTGGTVKILDFGIARAAGKSAMNSDYDAGDLGALTPAYATVEMVNGEPPSFSDDVYALACVLYVMLTGEHPYDRKSAADAKAGNLKPARPACLNNREWQALSAGLAIDKTRRPPTVDAFRTLLLPQKRRGGFKSIAALLVLALGAGGWFVYQQHQTELEQQRAIDNRLQVAKDCLYTDDFKCAIENALVVRSLVPENMESGRLLELAEQGQADAEQARVDAERATQIMGHLQEAQSCLDEAQVDCARAALAEAREAGAQPAELYPIQRAVDALDDELMASARDREQRLDLLLEEGRACLESGNFDCADDRVAQLLAANPDSSRATELRRSVASARQQQQFRETTVAGFLQEAQDCLERKNYSCSIAKSESALAIIPRHPDASAMIRRADEAQQKAKKNIAIE
ncbi:serine/threonine-protein kinase [Kineobactrum sediminis]|uniref:serine/threonine-protein kinase n=1 Tax=Kineobactrum sediminis TaxID=1905677 RepID=UPI0013905353|nr:serine/threonine-protein kinase [Kineobactrum sediminis]